ncbi:hypothetical protein K438DRAFT_1842163 [Mycena galopus ATCC 62051]|nr:hypothetical protein K438DRAFT_1842163 [Mycena galopus ATCC 62051]
MISEFLPAAATSPTAPGKLGFGAQLGLAQAQRPAGSGQHQPPLSPVSRSNIGPFHTSPRDPRLAPGYKQQASKSYGNRTHRPSNTSERQV